MNGGNSQKGRGIHTEGRVGILENGELEYSMTD